MDIKQLERLTAKNAKSSSPKTSTPQAIKTSSPRPIQAQNIRNRIVRPGKKDDSQEIQNLKQQVRDAKRDLKTCQQELKDSKEANKLRLEQLQNENDRLQKQLAKMQDSASTVAEKEMKYATVEQDLENLTKKVALLEQQRDQRLDELHEAESKVTQLENTIEEIYREEEQTKDRASELTRIVEESKNQIDELRMSVHLKQTKFESLKREFDDTTSVLNRELTQFKQSSEEYELSSIKLTKRVEILESELTETKDSLEKTQTTLSDERNDWKIERGIQDKKTSDLIKDLKSQLKKEISKNKMLLKRSSTGELKKPQNSKPTRTRGWRVNDRVELDNNRWGVIKYIGGVSFADGIWYGVELDEPTGKHDGKIADRRYFTAKPKCGTMVRSHKIVSGEFNHENGSSAMEPFQWFDQLSEERRTNLLKSITAAVSNTINGWTGLTEIAQQFGLTETQIKQAYSYAQASDHDKHPTTDAPTKSIFQLSGDPAEHLRWENQKQNEKITYLERSMQNLNKELSEKTGIINRFIEKVEKDNMGADFEKGALGRSLWLQMQDLYKQNEARQFQIKQLGLEVKRLFRVKQEKDDTIATLKQDLQSNIQNLSMIDKLNKKLTNMDRIVSMKEGEIRKLRRQVGNDDTGVVSEMWDANDLEQKIQEEDSIKADISALIDTGEPQRTEDIVNNQENSEDSLDLNPFSSHGSISTV